MTTATEQLSDLIRDLVTSYISHGDELRIEATEHPGAVYWDICGHADDYGKLVGREGAHYDALRRIIAAIGEARGEQHVLRRFAEPREARRTSIRRTEPATQYDPTEMVALLDEILDQLFPAFFVGAEVKENSNARLPFRLLVTLTVTVTVRTDADYGVLLGGAEPLIGALGTLFRAGANVDGVGVQINVDLA